MRDKIFISYCHKDSLYQLRLRVHLSLFERKGKLNFWVDTKLLPGDKWRDEIMKALSETLVAILLVSADFLASDFILNNEVPMLLKACKDEGIKIIPVILKPCAFEMFEISDFQSVNDPRNPVCAMTEAGQEEIWAEVAKEAWKAYETASQKAGSAEEKGIFTLPDTFQAKSVEETYKYSANEHESFYEDGARSFLRNLISNPKDVLDYYIYTYSHIDVLDFLPKVDSLLNGSTDSDTLLNCICAKFKENGWDGDGNIRLLWLPPFLDIGVEDTWGTIVLFVKQLNNGVSFIASPVQLNFKRLLEQQD